MMENDKRTDLLTVFQAAPLACTDQNGNYHAMGAIDLEFERELLSKTFQEAGANILVDFEMATSDALSSFLARKEGRISCHGHPRCLFLENDWGGMFILKMEELKRWIELGGQNLQFVFVAACYSRLIGQAFVDAGVPHVVCCDSQIREAAAVEFEKTFYRNSAHGRTLQEAYDIAKHEILVSPNIAPEHRQIENENFYLLPDGADHNVPIFFQRPVAMSQKKRFVPTVQFPPPPHVFVGREIDQFNILQALQTSRLVRVSGNRGIGKVDLIKACCRYLNYRLHMVDFHDILWVPHQEEIRNGEPFCHFQTLLVMIKNSSPSHRFLDEAQQFIAKLVDYFHFRKTLLVINAKEVCTDESLTKLSVFLEAFIKGTRAVKVIVIHQQAERITTTRMPTVAQHIRVASLNYESSVKLFALLCPRLVGTRTHGVACPGDLHGLLIDPDNKKSRMTNKMTVIFKMIGEGNPLEIQNVANSMTMKEYSELLLLGSQKDESPLPFDSITALEERQEELREEVADARSRKSFVYALKLEGSISDLEKQKELFSRAAIESRQTELLEQISRAAQQRNFLRAQELQMLHDDLEQQKQQLPTIDQLHSQFDEMTFEIEEAASMREWLKAQTLQDELDRLEVAIRAETNAQNARLMGDDTEIMTTRASLEAKITQLEDDYKEACDKNEFVGARQIDAESKRLKEARPSKPARVDLAIKVAMFERQLKAAKVERRLDAAEMIYNRLQATLKQLKLEEEAEETMGITVASDRENIDKIQNGPISLPPSAARTVRESESSSSDPPGSVGSVTPSAVAKIRDERKMKNQRQGQIENVSARADGSASGQDSEPTRRRRRQEPLSSPNVHAPGAVSIPGPGGNADENEIPAVHQELEVQGYEQTLEQQTQGVEQIEGFVSDLPDGMINMFGLPDAAQVANVVLDEQILLEEMIVDTIKKHTIQAAEVVPEEEEDEEELSSSSDEEGESSEGKGGQPALVSKFFGTWQKGKKTKKKFSFAKKK